MSLIYIQLNTGVSIKLKHYKAANFQCQLRKILRLFLVMLFVVFIIIFLLSRIAMLLYISVYIMKS